MSADSIRNDAEAGEAVVEPSLLRRAGKVIDDHINPIVVKELRQAVRGRFLVVVMVLFLVVAMVVVGVTLLNMDPLSGGTAYGRGVFLGLYSIMLFTCVVLIPTFVGVRMAVERSGENLDLLYVTPLTSGAIIRGKAFSAMVLAVLVFSICLPFLTLTYLMRGIDLPTIAVMMGIAVLAVVAAVFYAILMASIPGSRGLKALLGLMGLGGLSWLFGIIVMVVGDSIFMGRGMWFDTWEFWGAVGTMTGLTVLSTGLMGACAQACIMPASANRALSIRLWITGAWVFGLIAALAWAVETGDRDVLLGWMIPALVLLSVALLGAISERETTGPRLARSIPANPLGRVMAFLFFSGAGGGVIWCLLLMAATIVLSMAAGTMLPGHAGRISDFSIGMLVLIGIGLYMVSYALTAGIIRRSLLARWVRPGQTWAVALGLFSAAMVVPVLLILLVIRAPMNSLDDRMGLFLLTPMTLYDSPYRSLGLTVSAIWAGIALMLSLPWIGRQFRDFRTLKRPARPPARAEVLHAESAEQSGGGEVDG